jgi:NAD+ synthase (glutamine-hydrolysing)
MDSALVLAIVKKSLKKDQYLEAVYMPGLFSASISYELSLELCKNLQVPMSTMPIKFSHKSIRNLFKDSFGTPLDGVADENIQSRLRGAFLYGRSNQINSMVLNTSNKSEISVGYSTQYGDSVGALSVLGDLYKSEVFTLARYINRKYGNIIPVGIIDRPPSAELREGQQDAQSLPPYEELDAILEGILSYRHSVEDLIKMGMDQQTVEKVFSLWKKTEFKRSQFCPIIKVKQKSFGFGYRVPICKRY